MIALICEFPNFINNLVRFYAKLVNGYRYVGNNAVNYTDPEGLSQMDRLCCMLRGGIWGKVVDIEFGGDWDKCIGAKGSNTYTKCIINFIAGALTLKCYGIGGVVSFGALGWYSCNQEKCYYK
ncbi:MAG: hypothetical protein NZM04_05560 [Methylacidiphilales bacterium]|nr:hypothetical protein [Candidatus Methylacidiphilales bacterium]